MRWVLSLLWVLVAQPVQAGEIFLRLPDDVLRARLEKRCLWSHCESEANGGYKSSQEKAQWVLEHELRPLVDAAIRTMTRNTESFESLGAALDVRFDSEQGIP